MRRLLSFLLASVTTIGAIDADSLWSIDDPAPFRAYASWNPNAPFGGNDGALWQGRGLNLQVSGGIEHEWEGFRFRFYPELDASQDLAYTMLNGPGDYWVGLDRVQSYQQGAFWRFGWGQSEVRYQSSLFTVGWGNVPLVLGHSVSNHVLLSNNAGGFPHLDLGTPGPLDTPWGSFETTLVWGGLYDSRQYFQQVWDRPEEWRFFHALVAGYTPPFWPELTMGFGRTFTSPMATVTPFKALQSVVDTVWKRDRGLWSGRDGIEDDIDQQIALFLLLDLVPQGLELSAELGRTDHASGLVDFLLQPWHSFGYTFTLRKSFSFLDVLQAYLLYEQSDLGMNWGSTLRITPSWYRHGPYPLPDGGHTLGGQLLGAPIGPGSNSNYFELGLTLEQNRAFLGLSRVAKDLDFWMLNVRPKDFHSEDLALAVTGGLEVRVGGWVPKATVTWIKEYNRYWIRGNYLRSWQITTEIIWRPQ